MVHRTPSDKYSCETVQSLHGFRIIRCSTIVPKPFRSESFTGGPPASASTRNKRPAPLRLARLWQFGSKMSAVHTIRTRSHLGSCCYERLSVAPQGRPVMNEHARECLKRAAECTRIAEATSDPELQVYLMKLGSSWMQAATGEREERNLEEGLQRRPLKTLNDLFC
jgi:hypothetical protein